MENWEKEGAASNPTFALVGAASGMILAPNPERKAVHFVNDSPNLIYLTKRDPAALNIGIRLNPNGGQWWEPDEEGRVWKWAWYAIATVAASNLCITEDW